MGLPVENSMKPTPTAAPTQDWPGHAPSRSWSLCLACDPPHTEERDRTGVSSPCWTDGKSRPKVAGLSQKARGKSLVHSLPFGEHCALAPTPDHVSFMRRGGVSRVQKPDQK